MISNELNITDMSFCCLCPRNCKVDRTKNSFGFCKSSEYPKAALASIHKFEEPPISGTRGSGTVFFSGCNLKCAFCQNYEISQLNKGKELSTDELAEIFINQQNKNVHNLNLVSAGHFLPKVREALIKAKSMGLKIPVVYNSSGYEKVEAIKLLEGLIDIYLPDIKYYSAELSAKYSGAADYFKIASSAVKEMYRQVGKNEFDSNGIMQKGVIIRHLVLPNCRKDSFKVLDFIKETFGDNVYVSILNQYTPMYKAKEIKELNRRVTTFEYNSVIDYFFNIGLKYGYMQERNSATSAYTPVFDLSGLDTERNE